MAHRSRRGSSTITAHSGEFSNSSGAYANRSDRDAVLDAKRWRTGCDEEVATFLTSCAGNAATVFLHLKRVKPYDKRQAHAAPGMGRVEQSTSLTFLASRAGNAVTVFPQTLGP